MNKFYAVAVGIISGLLLGLVGAFVQADRIRIAGRLVPYGALLAIALIAVAQLILVRHFQTRIAAITLAVGWVIASQTLGGDQPYNTAVIMDATWSKIYMLTSAIVIGIICTLKPLRRVPSDSDSGGLPEPFSNSMSGGQPPSKPPVQPLLNSQVPETPADYAMEVQKSRLWKDEFQ